MRRWLLGPGGKAILHTTAIVVRRELSGYPAVCVCGVEDSAVEQFDSLEHALACALSCIHDAVRVYVWHDRRMAARVGCAILKARPQNPQHLLIAGADNRWVCSSMPSYPVAFLLPPVSTIYSVYVGCPRHFSHPHGSLRVSTYFYSSRCDRMSGCRGEGEGRQHPHDRQDRQDRQDCVHANQSVA